jgi:hypothetical protein
MEKIVSFITLKPGNWRKDKMKKILLTILLVFFFERGSTAPPN